MRGVAQRIAWSYLGRPYIWGGDDPEGFDCSGLIIEALKSVGILPRAGDWTAAALLGLFAQIKEKDLRAGDLVFWGNPVVHVEMIIKTKVGEGAQPLASAYGWDAYAAQARSRGREAMTALQEGYPGLTVFLTFGHSLPFALSDGGRRPLAEAPYGLLAPFLDGLVEAAPAARASSTATSCPTAFASPRSSPKPGGS